MLSAACVVLCTMEESSCICVSVYLFLCLRSLVSQSLIQRSQLCCLSDLPSQLFPEVINYTFSSGPFVSVTPALSLVGPRGLPESRLMRFASIFYTKPFRQMQPLLLAAQLHKDLLCLRKADLTNLSEMNGLRGLCVLCVSQWF